MYSSGGWGGGPMGNTNPFRSSCNPTPQPSCNTNPFLRGTAFQPASCRRQRSASCPPPSAPSNTSAAALQSIAVALSRMQEAMTTMKSKTEQTDQAITCVSGAMTMHADALRRLENKITTHEERDKAMKAWVREEAQHNICVTHYRIHPRSVCMHISEDDLCAGCHSLVPLEDQSTISPQAVKDALARFKSCPRVCDVRVSPRTPCYCTERAERLGKKLFKAVKDKTPRRVERLLKKGADPNYLGQGNWTPLHRAAARSNTIILQQLLVRGADVRAKTISGFTPLHIAAYHDDSGRCVVILLNSGADINARTRMGLSALHFAAKTGNIAAVRALKARGARETARDHVGRCPQFMTDTSCLQQMLHAYKHLWPLRMPPYIPICKDAT